MPRRRVQLLSKAERDLDVIAEAIGARVSLVSSIRKLTLIQAAIAGLADSAELHPEAYEAIILGRDIRMRLVGKRPHVYRILFTYSQDVVIVHRIRHAAQDFLKEDEF